MTKIVRTKQAGDAWGTSVEPAGGSGGGLSATVDLSSADILDLANTPITLVDAQGAGTVIVPSIVVLSYQFGSVPYTINGNLSIGWGPNGTVCDTNVDNTAMLSLGADQFGIGPADPDNFDATAGMVDQPLRLTAAASPTDGDGTLSVTTYYVVYSLA